MLARRLPEDPETTVDLAKKLCWEAIDQAFHWAEDRTDATTFKQWGARVWGLPDRKDFNWWVDGIYLLFPDLKPQNASQVDVLNKVDYLEHPPSLPPLLNIGFQRSFEQHLKNLSDQALLDRLKYKEVSYTPTAQSTNPPVEGVPQDNSTIAVKRGCICVRITDEMKTIRYMFREAGKSITEIQAETPDFRFWQLVKSDALPEEDRETALHPNQWGTGYPALLLSKYFKRSKATIRDYKTAYKPSRPRQKTGAH